MKAIKVHDVTNMTKAEWLEARQEGIGASDIGAIAGVNTWQSPMSIYLSKVKPVELKEPTLPQKLGLYLEPFIQAEAKVDLADRIGREIEIVRDEGIFRNPDLPDWARTSIDFIILDEANPKGNGLLEVKTTNQFLADAWADTNDYDEGRVPPSYYCQAHWEMGVMGLEYCWLACLVGNQDLVYVYVEFDSEVFNSLLEIARKFWEGYVIPRIMPPPDGSKDADEVIKKMYPDHEPDTKVDLSEFEKKLIQRDLLMQEISTREKEKKQIEQEIKMKMGTAEKGFTPVNNDSGFYFDVSFRTTAGRRSIDFDRLEAEEPILYKKYVSRKPQRTLRIYKKRG